MKPLIRTAIPIPAPFRVWCHLCNQGFMSMEEGQKHDKDFINKHQKINGAREEANAPQKASKKS